MSTVALTLVMSLAVVIAALGLFFWKTRKERTLRGNKGLWWLSLSAALYSLFTVFEVLRFYAIRDQFFIIASGSLVGAVLILLLRRRVRSANL
jgi:hypothetical protein